MPVHKKQKRAKGYKAITPTAPPKRTNKETIVSKPKQLEPAMAVKGPMDLATQVKRLTADFEALKADLRKRPGGEEGLSRRDQDKILADRLARLDEKIESLWGRVADLEEHFEGEGGTRTREPDFDETPDRDFYEH
jgi:hypothetical protein